MRIDAGFRLAAIGWLLAGLILSGIAMARGPVEWREIVEQAKPEPGLSVSYGESPSQFGELYLPEGEGPFPLLVLIHGGCWRVEYGLDHVAPLADELREAGVAVWSLEYRRLGEEGGGWPGTFDDMAAGFDRIEGLSESHPLDLDRVVLAGHSAGGHLALWLAARHRLPPDHRWHADSMNGLQGVVGLAAISDLARYAEGEGACNRAAAELLGENESDGEDHLALVSPDRLLPPAAPVHLIHGREDAIVALKQSVVHAARIRAAGGEARRHILEGAGHFDLIAPFAPAWAEVRSVLLTLLGIERAKE
ncbi:alpha/beta hydrolase [Wenzhouxiangella sp. EGI_FJ10409]|uniref:alpha/beta hydrolase n=1 Tax=Wenzhouxiangella sp. EGI_FJ10409 TaxID=3243767 RepID=UPI0035D96656